MAPARHDVALVNVARVDVGALAGAVAVGASVIRVYAAATDGQRPARDDGLSHVRHVEDDAAGTRTSQTMTPGAAGLCVMWAIQVSILNDFSRVRFVSCHFTLLSLKL